MTEDGKVITQDIRGQAHTITVGGDGEGAAYEFRAAGPRHAQGFSLLGNPKQNSELQKAVGKLKDKESSEADKAAAKEKITSILANSSMKTCNSASNKSPTWRRK